MSQFLLKKSGIAALLPLAIAQATAWLLAPAAAIIWLLLSGAWSAAGWCILSALFTAFLAYITLFVGGFLGPLGILLLPVAVAAYAQHDFLSFAGKSLAADYQVQFTIFSLLIGVIPTMYLGKGEENEPSVISMSGLFAVIAGISAWLYYKEFFNDYWHFALMYLFGSILGFFISAGIAKATEA